MTERLNALTSMRFFAALHVLLFHLQGVGPWPVPQRIAQVLGAGFVSVSFFFVLSGFILTQSYAQRPPHQRLRKYAVGRLARIYPLYFLALLLMLPHWLKQGSLAPSVATLFLAQAWVPPWAMAWNPPGWSLSVEVFFYAMFPLLLPMVLRASAKAMWVLATVGWATGLGLSFAYGWVQPDGLAHVDDSTQVFWLEALKFHPLMRLPEFVVGMTLGKSFLQGGWPRLSWAGAGAALALFVALLWADAIPYPVLHNGVLTPLFVLTIAAAAQGGTSLAHRWLSHPWLVTLGEASYALYILQTPVVALVHGLAKRLWPAFAQHPFSFSMLAVVVSVVASLVAWAFIERPARQWLVNRFG